MNWPTWQQALIAAILAIVAVVVLRRRHGRIAAAVVPAAREFTGVALLYSLWRIARELPLSRDAGAIERARSIWSLQQQWHLPSELSLQRLVLRSDLLAEVMNAYYAVVHVPALIAFLVWLWIRHRDAYPHWRNGLVVTTAGCLLIRYVRVAPPRFLPELGFVDFSHRYGFSVYGPNGTGVSDQMAAMPSIHCGWAAVVGLGIWCLAPRRFRWIGPVHLALTFVVVAATGNHWWLDGIVAVAILVMGLLADRWWRDRRSVHGDEAPARVGSNDRGRVAVDSITGDPIDIAAVGAEGSGAGVRLGVPHRPVDVRGVDGPMASDSDGAVGGGEDRLQ